MELITRRQIEAVTQALYRMFARPCIFIVMEYNDRDDKIFAGAVQYLPASIA